MDAGLKWVWLGLQGRAGGEFVASRLYRRVFWRSSSGSISADVNNQIISLPFIAHSLTTPALRYDTPSDLGPTFYCATKAAQAISRHY